MNLSHVQNKLSIHTRSAGEEHRAMLIIVPRKKVINEDIKILTSYSKSACIVHDIFSRKSNTFRIFEPTFCNPPCAALFLRDT